MVVEYRPEDSEIIARLFEKDCVVDVESIREAGIRHEFGELEPKNLRRHTFLRLYAQDFSTDEKERILRSL